MRIHLIRHGETELNAIHTIDTAFPGAPLTDRGREQARNLVERLDGIEFDALYVSSLRRTHQTAAPLAQARGLTPIERPGLREIEAGSWELGDSDDEYRGYFATLLSWIDGDLSVAQGGGVRGEETLARFDAVIREIEESGAQSVAVFSHGAMIGCWSAIRAEGITERAIFDRHLPNTGMCVIEGSLDEGYRALSWNDEEVRPGTW
ncbi:histidine phosphatase family protein [Arcanobacterium haemolyticum]|nr:histidine phosphatase family protein [Arcanobacterium haemolyticum]